MNNNIRSLYIRVLRGKFDYNKIYHTKCYVNLGTVNISKFKLKKLHASRKFPVLRNIRDEIDWFKRFHAIKYEIFNDKDAPEEILASLMGVPITMPSCYKKAEKYLVNKDHECKNENHGKEK